MRRSICYCEPNNAFAGEVNTWHFIYTPGVALPKGTKLRFDLASKGRELDWGIPDPTSKGKNQIFAKLENGKTLPPKLIHLPESFMPTYEFTLPSGIEPGGTFTIVLGAIKNPSTNGTKAQNNAQRRRAFYLYVDPSGKGKYDEPEVFHMDVKGNVLKSIRVIAPSFVARNKRFDVIVRFEDEFGNLTSYAPEDTLIELSHEHLRENLNWKLFIPETGFITLPNLYFNEAGIYTIQLKNAKTKEVFRSAPIKCFPENGSHLYWGLLHGESERIDSTENIDNFLRHMRDEKAFNFFASSPFESLEETSNETWKTITQNLAEFDEADRFSCFAGFQWSGVRKEEGVRQFVYLKDGKQILRKKDPKYTALNKIYKLFSPKEFLSIPCFTMAKGFEYDFKNFEPDFERVVEIYNAWGSSEQLKKEGNPYPIQCEGKRGIYETGEGSIQQALLRNCRFGFVAGGLDDRELYSDLLEGDQIQYNPGLTAIIASEHTRPALAEALYNRSCYATTGERIILGLSLAGLPMGSETTTQAKSGLRINRHLSGYAAGTTDLEKIEIIRNGAVLKTFEGKGYSLDFEYDDMIPIEKVVINAKDKKPPFVYYYLRVTQKDGHMAWSSPIWVDYLPPSPSSKLPAKKTTPKPLPKMIIEDEDDFEEDDDDDFDE